jgi:hypothetical protein
MSPRPISRSSNMTDLIIALAFIGMIVGPAIVASLTGMKA